MPRHSAGITIRDAQVLGGVKGQEGLHTLVGEEPEEDREQDAQSTFDLCPSSIPQTCEHVGLFFWIFKVLGSLMKMNTSRAATSQH